MLAKVGIYELHRDGARYALRTRQGETVGTYETARQATDAGVALIVAARKVSK